MGDQPSSRYKQWEWFFARHSPLVVMKIYDSVDRTLERLSILPDSTSPSDFFSEQMERHGLGRFQVCGHDLTYSQARAIYFAIESSPTQKSAFVRMLRGGGRRYSDEKIEFMQMNPDVDSALLPYIDTDPKLFDSPEIRKHNS